MINVKAIDRQLIEQWPIDFAGLPQRVINSCASADIKTVGELRCLSDRELRTMRGIGAGSVRAIKNFLDTCDKISAERLTFVSLKSIFDTLLKKDQQEILALRYGLHSNECAASRKQTTLQAIGARHRVCRERVRQMENKAKNALKSRMAQACLQQVYEEYEAFIKEKDCVATLSDIATLADTPIFEGYNPCGVLLLLSDCSGYPHFHSGFFTTLSIDRLKAIETKARAFLESQGAPQPLSALLDALSGLPLSVDGQPRAHVIRCTLSHSPRILSTTDDRYFLPGTGSAHIVAEIIKKLPVPAHFRTILKKFNELMIPGSRKGPGHVLEVLQTSRRFSRTSSGYYQLQNSRIDSRIGKCAPYSAPEIQSDCP